jgi:hypothetical protein
MNKDILFDQWIDEQNEVANIINKARYNAKLLSLEEAFNKKEPLTNQQSTLLALQYLKTIGEL